MTTFLTCALSMGISLMLASTSGHAEKAPWTDLAVSTDPAEALQAQDHLRDRGPEGLEELRERFASEIQAHQKGAPVDEAWKRIATALNRISGQYDDAASELYWYTDLEKAKATARATGKPILSLHLLGRLDEDLSCANSRFFRTALYPNEHVNMLLRDQFILHWESVRPVPLVTIDFGDGHKLVRTITGNSIHYVLTPDGQIVDALPGLYGATTFVHELKLAAQVASPAPGTQGNPSLVEYQKSTRQRLLEAWKDDLNATTDSKASLTSSEDAALLENLTDTARWQRIASLHFADTLLDDGSRQAVENKFPSAVTAAPLTISKSAVENPMLRALRNLQATMALDNMRNNYLLRTKILAYLTSPAAQGQTLPQINDWVYAQIFLTPRNDPWLGLAPQDVFSGIDQNGETPR